jgi:hypothetical protein
MGPLGETQNKKASLARWCLKVNEYSKKGFVVKNLDRLKRLMKNYQFRWLSIKRPNKLVNLHSWNFYKDKAPYHSRLTAFMSVCFS